MQEQLVSIIVPVYNSQKTIKRCLTSILGQTYKNLEIIVVDDGSTDNSLQIINQYKSDSRIHLISKKNGGVSSARNTGLSIAKGHFVQFVDSDDYLSPNMTERLMSLMDVNNCDLVICGYKYINKSKVLHLSKQLYDGADAIENAFLGLWETTYINIPWNKLYRKELCEGLSFPLEVTLGEDLIFNIQYLKRCQRLFVSDELLYNYYWAGEGKLTTKFYEGTIDDIKAMSQAIAEYLGDKKFQDNTDRINFVLRRSYRHSVQTLAFFKEKSLKEKNRLLKSWQEDDFVKAIFASCNDRNDLKLFKKSIINLYFYFQKVDYIRRIKTLLKRIVNLK
ncbi:MAG: glycosyltransferase family 2 protein [Floccifex sp.]